MHPPELQDGKIKGVAMNKHKLLSRLLCAATAMVLVSGCAATKLGDAMGGSSSAMHTSNSDPSKESKDDSLTTSSEAGKSSSAVEMVFHDQKIPATTYDLPVEMNPAVAKWITYFTGKGRERFEKYLERSEYFIPYIKPILKNAKAPEDLVYLAMIESGFNNNARSGARAVGAWQFMSATGRRYGLDVNWWIDERRDVEKSTIAAIQYLKELNVMFGSWHLATAAYNAGEGKIGRAIKKYHTDDFWELCNPKFKYLRPETKNYVPKLFAAAIIGHNRKYFGFKESYTNIKSVSAELVAEKAEETAPIERLPDVLEGDKSEGEADAKNTAAQPSVEITKDSPADPEEDKSLARDSVETMLRTMSAQIRTPHVNRKGEVNGDILVEVEIPSPADLFKVSSAAGLSYLEFKSMNPELLRWLTPPGENYRVRLPLSHKEAFMKKYFDPTFQRDVTFLVYKARRGDTPRGIAKRFGISADPVVDMNEMRSPASSFSPGTLVELPIPNDFVRSLASLKQLDLLDPADPKRRRHRRGGIRRHRRSRHSSAARDGASSHSRF
ncbi:MAG: transglycosylase SLT domain-containing protein [Bdellovibrionales bacterium]|nr:transglycosylase SLT domain-containing protein [Oligoflexia bacterium]